MSAFTKVMSYQYKFQKVKYAKSYCHTYWKHDENQDEGYDVTMTVYEFLVDYVTDDLHIPEIVT